MIGVAGRHTTSQAVGETSPQPRILIADDERPVRELLRELLKGVYECREAPSAEDALALLRAEDFALVLSDIMMGEWCSLAELRDAIWRARWNTRAGINWPPPPAQGQPQDARPHDQAASDRSADARVERSAPVRSRTSSLVSPPAPA